VVGLPQPLLEGGSHLCRPRLEIRRKQLMTATRYDRITWTFAGMITAASAMMWLI
jgi:hypothetical protein